MYSFYIIFGFIHIPNILNFTFLTFTLKSLILTINNRFLSESLFLLIKYISAYLLDKNFVPCLFAHTMHLSCAAVSYLQLSAALPPQAIKLVVLTNPNLSALFLTLWKYFNSLKLKKRNKISNNSKSCGVPAVII